MASIEFIFKGNKITIQSNFNEKLKDIIDKYTSKISIDKNTLIFLYSGKLIDEELKLYEIIGKEKINKIIILVHSKNNINDTYISIIKSKYIICPKCKENIHIEINDYKIYLYEYKNGHSFGNILLNEFEKTQYIDISKIICKKCKEKNKGNTFQNEFYKCLSCNINLCPLCKSTHDKTHDIINYDQKNYICQKHNDIYVKFCYECKINLCLICENEHKNHKSISYGEIIPNIEENNIYLYKLRHSIDLFKNNIKKIKNIKNKITNKIINNIEIYYNINKNIINNYDKKNRNYEILQNIKDINNNNILDEINQINQDKNIKNKINNIINIYIRMFYKKADINLISNNAFSKELSYGFCRVSDTLSLRLPPERKYKPTTTYKTNCDIICCDPCFVSYSSDPFISYDSNGNISCRFCCYCCPSICYPSNSYKPKLNFDYDSMESSNDDICDSKYNIGNIGNSQAERGSKSLPSYNQPNSRKDRNDINDGNNRSYGNDRNIRNDGNAYNDYEQKQFNYFLKKLMDVESNIENAKSDLANYPDFNVEDAFKLFDIDNKEYITKKDLKNGLNSLGFNPTDQDVRLLMKRFDLQKRGKINYADFFDMIVSFKPELRNKIENKEFNQSSLSKSQEAPNEQVINGLKNLFDLIIKSEKEINDMRKSFGTLRLNLKDIFGLLDKGGKGYFTIEEMVGYLKKNGLFSNNQEANLLFTRLDKTRKGNISFPEIEEEIKPYLKW